MKNLKRGLTAAAFACLVLGAAAAPSFADEVTTVTTRTTSYGTPMIFDRIGMARAQDIALGEQPGVIRSSTVARGMDGRPVYVFDIGNRSGIYSVTVDGVNGRIVNDVQEGVRYHRPNFWERLFAPTNVGD